MKALVTGCAGFIGSHLSENLLNDGHEVVGVDYFNDNYARELKQTNLSTARSWDQFRLIEDDLAEIRLDSLVSDCDAIFHLAAEPGVRASWGSGFDRYVRNNIEATQRLLEATNNASQARFVYGSSSSVYGHADRYPTSETFRPSPYSPYGVTKLAAEHLVSLYNENLGLDGVSLRFFTVYGPRQRPDMAFTRCCLAALGGEPFPMFGDGSQIRDFTFVGDIVAGLRRAAASTEAASDVYNLGGGTQISLSDAIRVLEGVSDACVPIDRRGTQRGDVRRTGADITLARKELGYEPATPLDKGLKAQFAWAVDQSKSEPGGSMGQGTGLPKRASARRL